MEYLIIFIILGGIGYLIHTIYQRMDRVDHAAHISPTPPMWTNTTRTETRNDPIPPAAPIPPVAPVAPQASAPPGVPAGATPYSYGGQTYYGTPNGKFYQPNGSIVGPLIAGALAGIAVDMLLNSSRASASPVDPWSRHGVPAGGWADPIGSAPSDSPQNAWASPNLMPISEPDHERH